MSFHIQSSRFNEQATTATLTSEPRQNVFIHEHYFQPGILENPDVGDQSTRNAHAAAAVMFVPVVRSVRLVRKSGVELCDQLRLVVGRFVEDDQVTVVDVLPAFGDKVGRCRPLRDRRRAVAGMIIRGRTSRRRTSSSSWPDRRGRDGPLDGEAEDQDGVGSGQPGRACVGSGGRHLDPRAFQDHDVSPRIWRGRLMERAAHLVASVMSVRPAMRRAPTARLRRAAMMRGPDRVLTLEASSW
jgi:hypothetical protein